MYRHRIKIQLVIIAVLLGFLAGPRIMQAIPLRVANTESTTPTSTETNPVINVPLPAESFVGIELNAQSVYVWDIKDRRRLFSKNESAILPLASITKMMMAVVAIESLPDNTEITITADDLRAEGDSGLRVGEKWALRTLLEFTLVVSSNDGASAIAAVGGAQIGTTTAGIDRILAKRLFIEKMNQKAKVIGLEHTTFNNETGLDIESYESGAYGSAKDMALMFDYIFRKHPELFHSTNKGESSFTSESNIVHHVANTNMIVDQIPGIIGSKTGYTDLAGGNLVVIIDIGIDHPVVLSVLGSTRESRFEDIEKLLAGTIAAITHQPLP